MASGAERERESTEKLLISRKLYKFLLFHIPFLFCFFFSFCEFIFCAGDAAAAHVRHFEL